MVDWNGRPVPVLAPHDVAFMLLLRKLLPHRPSEELAPSWVVDFHALTGVEGFLPEVFTDTVMASGWGGLFADHARTAIDYLTVDQLQLLGGTTAGGPSWGRQLRKTHSVRASSDHSPLRALTTTMLPHAARLAVRWRTR